MINEGIKTAKDDISFSSYESPLQHLQDELNILDLQLLRFLRGRNYPDENERNDVSIGLFISENEVLSLLNGTNGHINQTSSTTQEDTYLTQLINERERQIEEKILNTGAAFSSFPLSKLQAIFNLDRFETYVLVMAIAPEVDTKYERIYAFFNDDLNKKAPSMDLALKIFTSQKADRITQQGYFSNPSSLSNYQLIHFVEGNSEESRLSNRFKIDEGIKNLLLCHESLIHPYLCKAARLEYANANTELSDRKNEKLNEIHSVLFTAFDQDLKGVVFWLYGKSANEKKTIVQSLCNKLSIPLLVADLEDLSEDRYLDRDLDLLFREAILKSAALYIIEADLLTYDSEKHGNIRRLLLSTIKKYDWFVFFDAQNYWLPEAYDDGYKWCPIEIRTAEYFERRNVWAYLLQQFDIKEDDIDAVAGRFIFNEDQIMRTVHYLQLKLQKGSTVELDSLLHACSIQSPKKMPQFTKKITPRYKWDDLVLPNDKLRHLKEICGFLKHKHKVYYKWGFDKKLSLGRGLNILFTGPSGTGKTMTAEILAMELKLALYKTDLSSIVSKYIGETEKNLEKIFDAASSGNAILFFDEADALFGKRSEVKDAHDRFANIETNYLLQRIEEHEGVVILSTNLRKNMDEAFLRRMQFMVEFPFPNEKYREIIWKKVYPDETPICSKVDYRFLAKKLDISGGNIKNIALASAFLGAGDSASVEMKHILLAAGREFQKNGKTFVKSDFGPYSDVIEMELFNG